MPPVPISCGDLDCKITQVIHNDIALNLYILPALIFCGEPMPSEELTKNLPHLIAIAVLIFALLIIATKTGLVGCSSLGDSYCDVYYSVLGKPTVLIIQGDSGMGNPDTLARMIERNHQLPVQTLQIAQISRGNIQDYSLIIVENAREIPTEKLKVFYDYLFEDMGRLVWVGDAGTIGSSADETCKLMEFSAEWKAEDGKHREDYDQNICVREDELNTAAEDTASEVLSAKRDALMVKAFTHLEELCTDAFDGVLDGYTPQGYPCDGGSYDGVYFKWTNENSFRSSVNPWSRGEYEKITTDGKEFGIDFGKNVLGVGFVTDDYAVAEFDAYEEGTIKVRDGLAKAHAGFVECHKALASSDTGCNLAEEEAIVRSDLTTLRNYQDSAETELSGIVTTLKSLAQQKEAKEESSAGVTIAYGKIESDIEEIKAVTIPIGTATTTEVTLIEGIIRTLKGTKEELVQLRGGEGDAVVKSNYDQHISTVESRITSFETEIPELKTHIADLGSCADIAVVTVADTIAAETGYESEMEILTRYSSPLIDENGAIDFINQVDGSKWESLARELENIQLECGGEEFTTGMAAAAEAIRAAQELSTDPATQSEALATMTVADVKHPLVEGVTKAKDLKKNDLPVPFVLVETNDIASHEVIQLTVTPAYKGINSWPGITVKDPKFASHVFGKGVVVYYAFPPETDEVFVKNLIEFMLY